MGHREDKLGEQMDMVQEILFKDKSIPESSTISLSF